MITLYGIIALHTRREPGMNSRRHSSPHHSTQSEPYVSPTAHHDTYGSPRCRAAEAEEVKHLRRGRERCETARDGRAGADGRYRCALIWTVALKCRLLVNSANANLIGGT